MKLREYNKKTDYLWRIDVEASNPGLWVALARHWDRTKAFSQFSTFINHKFCCIEIQSSWWIRIWNFHFGHSLWGLEWFQLEVIVEILFQETRALPLLTLASWMRKHCWLWGSEVMVLALDEILLNLITSMDYCTSQNGPSFRSCQCSLTRVRSLRNRWELEPTLESAGILAIRNLKNGFMLFVLFDLRRFFMSGLIFIIGTRSQCFQFSLIWGSHQNLGLIILQETKLSCVGYFSLHVDHAQIPQFHFLL